MNDRTYWLSIFNTDTWQEFLDAGGSVMGFPENRWKTVQRMAIGDYLICYLTKFSRWLAVLEITGDPYQGRDRIWAQATFPCRVAVRVVSHLTPDTAIPVLSLSKDLHLFDNLKHPNWGVLFRVSPRELQAHDGEVIAQAIAMAQAES